MRKKGIKECCSCIPQQPAPFFGTLVVVGELPLLSDFFENGFKDDDSFEVPTIATAPKGMDIATRKFLRTRFLKRKNKKESQTCLKGHCITAAPIWNFENKAVTRSIPSTPTCYAEFEQRLLTISRRTNKRTAMTMITSRMRKQAVSVPPPLHLLAWSPTSSSPTIQHVRKRACLPSLLSVLAKSWGNSNNQLGSIMIGLVR